MKTFSLIESCKKCEFNRQNTHVDKSVPYLNNSILCLHSASTVNLSCAAVSVIGCAVVGREEIFIIVFNFLFIYLPQNTELFDFLCQFCVSKYKAIGFSELSDFLSLEYDMGYGAPSLSSRAPGNMTAMTELIKHTVYKTSGNIGNVRQGFPIEYEDLVTEFLFKSTFLFFIFAW